MDQSAQEMLRGGTRVTLHANGRVVNPVQIVIDIKVGPEISSDLKSNTRKVDLAVTAAKPQKLRTVEIYAEQRPPSPTGTFLLL
jgi:hypothetical protein